jgi:TonB family protein
MTRNPSKNGPPRPVDVAPVRSRRHRTIGFWLGIAFLAHAEIALILGVAFYLLAPRDVDLQRELAARKGGEAIDVAMIDEGAARQILADLERQDEKRKEEEIEKEIDSIRAPGQVVDLPAPREQRRPEDARFAAEHDSTVEHETKKLGKFDEKARQGDSSGEATESHKATPAVPPDPRLAMRTPDLGRALKRQGPLGPLAPARRVGTTYGVVEPGETSPDGTLSELGTALRPQPSGGGAPSGGAPALTPSVQQLARAIGSGTQDALQDVDDGEETALSSKKWRFSAFFNRVKKQVAEHWHPEEAYRRRDPTGAVYGRQNRYTELRIQLKPDGRLANVGVGLPSGLEFLDDEAIEAFKEAQPFPNPPHQLLEASGLINFRFGFLFDLNGPPQMRWFRYNN